MATNIFGNFDGVPNSLIAIADAALEDVFEAGDISEIHLSADGYPGWAPGRPAALNPIVEIEKGKGYLVYALKDLDKTSYFAPPVPEGSAPSDTLLTPNLRVVGIGPNSCTLQWNEVADFLVIYVLEITTDNLNWQQVFSGDDVSATITGLNSSTFYRARLQATYQGMNPSSYDVEEFTTTTPVAQGPRYASAQDAATIENVEVGDFIIDGGDGVIINKNDLYLGPGKKICIRGGTYAYIYLGLANCTGTPENPVIITNYDGSVICPIELDEPNGIRVTGKYDPVAKTGNINYKGLDEFADDGVLAGTFGFFFKGSYDDSFGSGLHIHGPETSHVTVDNFEAGAGGYAGVMAKSDNYAATDMVNIHLRRFYIHDTNGEGIYKGNTSPDPQHQLIGSIVEDGILCRIGLNGIQVGQLRENCVVRNVTCALMAMAWSNPFMAFQDQTFQIQTRLGGAHVHHNLMIGGGECAINFFMRPKAGLPIGNTPTVIEHNAFLHLRGPYSAYINANSDPGTRVIIRNNYFGKHNGTYVKGYPGMFTTDCEIIVEAYASSVTIEAHNNITDMSTVSGGTFIDKSGDHASSITIESGNVRQSSLPDLQFKNFMGLPAGTDFGNIEFWTANFNTPQNSGPRSYDINEYVVRKGKLYRSKHTANAQNLPPELESDSHWELITFGGSTAIPDDVRLLASNAYAQAGIGFPETVQTLSVPSRRAAKPRVKTEALRSGVNLGRGVVKPNDVEERVAALEHRGMPQTQERFTRILDRVMAGTFSKR